MNAKTRQELLAMSQKAYREALFAGTSGNLSIYDRKNGCMLITPSSIAYEEMTAEDLMIVTLDGEIKEGKHQPSSEWRMHAAIYKNKPEVNAVIHTHSPYATSFAVNQMAIPVILIEMVPFLGGDVQVAEFAVPGTAEVGINCIEKIQERYACLMANHGVLAVGKDLNQAYIRAVYVEDAAKIYSHALSNGKVKRIEQKYIDQMLEQYKK